VIVFLLSFDILSLFLFFLWGVGELGSWKGKYNNSIDDFFVFQNTFSSFTVLVRINTTSFTLLGQGLIFGATDEPF